MRDEGSLRGESGSNTASHVVDILCGHDGARRRGIGVAVPVGEDWKMKRYKHPATSVLINVVMAANVCCIALVLYWWFANTFLPTTEMRDPMVDKTEYTAGDVMEFTAHVYRHRSCRIESRRIMEREDDGREYLVQFVTQEFLADDPVFPRVNTFRIPIPIELRSGRYDIYTRVRYFCNGLDFIIPRFMTTPKVNVYVTGSV